MVGFPMTKKSTFVGGVVKTLAGNVQGNAANLGKEHSQEKTEHCNTFLAEHRGISRYRHLQTGDHTSALSSFPPRETFWNHYRPLSMIPPAKSAQSSSTI